MPSRILLQSDDGDRALDAVAASVPLRGAFGAAMREAHVLLMRDGAWMVVGRSGVLKPYARLALDPSAAPQLELRAGARVQLRVTSAEGWVHTFAVERRDVRVLREALGVEATGDEAAWDALGEALSAGRLGDAAALLRARASEDAAPSEAKARAWRWQADGLERLEAGEVWEGWVVLGAVSYAETEADGWVYRAAAERLGELGEPQLALLALDRVRGPGEAIAETVALRSKLARGLSARDIRDTEALDAAETAALERLRSERGDVPELLVALARRVDDDAQARALLDRALEVSPEYAEALMVRLEAQVHQGNMEEAEPVCARLVARVGCDLSGASSMEVSEATVEALMLLGRWEDAAEALEVLRERVWDPDAAHLIEGLQQASRWCAAGTWWVAAAWLLYAVDGGLEGPRDALAFRVASRAAEAGAPRVAAVLWDEVGYDAAYDLAQDALDALGEDDEDDDEDALRDAALRALGVFAQARLRQSPSDIDALMGLAWSLTERGAVVEALEVVDGVVAREPANVSGHALKALLFEAAGAEDAALSAAYEGLGLEPEHPQLLRLVARCAADPIEVLDASELLLSRAPLDVEALEARLGALEDVGLPGARRLATLDALVAATWEDAPARRIWAAEREAEEV